MEDKSNLSLLIGLVAAITTVILGIIVALTVTSTIKNANLLGDAPTTIHTVTNESGAYVNQTGYILARVNASTSGYTITAIWVNVSLAPNSLPYKLGAGNNTVSATGNLTNISAVLNASEWGNANVSYTYTFTGDDPLAETTVNNLSSNFTQGINNVSKQIPTVLLVAAIIVVLGILVTLVAIWQKFQGTGQSL